MLLGSPDTQEEPRPKKYSDRLLSGPAAPTQPITETTPTPESEGDLAGGLRTFAGSALMGGGSEVAGLTAAGYGGLKAALEPDIPWGQVPEIMGKMYTAEEERARGLERQFAEEHPKAALSLNIGGALTTAAPLAAAGMARMVGAGAIPTIAASTGIGATEGAIAGALSAKPEERGFGAVIGGGVGGAGGLLFPVIGKVLGPTVRRTYEAVSAKFGGTSKQARDYLARSMTQAGITADDMTAEMRRIGPKAAPVDVASSIESLGEAAAQRPGVAREMALDFAEARSGEMFGRVTDLFRTAVGPKGRQIMQRVEDTPAFNNILSKSVPITGKLKGLLKRPSMKNAWREAQKLASETDQAMPDIDEFVAQVDRGEIVAVDTRLLHWIKKGLDDVIEPGRDPVTGSLIPKFGKNMVSALKGTRKAFRDNVKELNPEYGQALGRMAKEFEVDDAYKLGMDAFKPRHDASAVLKRLGGNERAANAYRQGVADKSLSMVEGAGELGQDVATPLIRKAGVLSKVFGKRSNDLIRGLKAQRKMRQTENRMIAGSQTGYRKALQESLADGVSAGEIALDVGGSAVTGVPMPGMLARGAKAFGGYVSGSPSGRALDELGAKILFEQNPAKAAAYLQQASAAQRNMAQMQGARAGLTGLFSQAPAITERLQ